MSSESFLAVKANLIVPKKSYGTQLPPTTTSVENLLARLEPLGLPLEDLAFSGHEEASLDLAEIDNMKLADQSYATDNTRNYTNTREIALARFDDEHVHPSKHLYQLAIDRKEAELSDDAEEAQRISVEMEAIKANLTELIALYEQLVLDQKNNTQELPVYYAGASDTLYLPDLEDNPLAYASGQFLLDEGYLSCYSIARLTESGAHVALLSDITDRVDQQITIAANHKAMEIGRVAVVTCSFEYPEID